MTGYIKLARGIMEHPTIGVRGKFSRFEAWTWLLFEAAWKPHKREIGGVAVDLKRGQLAHSTRYIAQAWGWPETNVRRFLSRLKTGAMIGAETGARTGAGVTIITICNYSTYQFTTEQTGAPDGAETGAETAQDRRKLEKGKQVSKKDAADAAPIAISDDADLYRRGKDLLGENAGGVIKNLVKAKGGSIPLARAAIETAATKENAREYIAACINTAGREAQRHAGRDPRL